MKARLSPEKIRQKLIELDDIELIELLNMTSHEWMSVLKDQALLKDKVRSQLHELCLAQYLYALSDSVQAGQMPRDFMEMGEGQLAS